jgi:hypothetical protein
MNTQLAFEVFNIVCLCFTLFQLGRAYEVMREIRKIS